MARQLNPTADELALFDRRGSLVGNGRAHVLLSRCRSRGLCRGDSDEQPLPDTVPGTVRYRRQKVNGAGLPVWKVSVSGCRSLQKVTAVAPVATTAATAYDMLD